MTLSACCCCCCNIFNRLKETSWLLKSCHMLQQVASRIVRQVSRLAGSSFTRWMATMFACLAYVVQIFHSNHTKSDAVSFDWGRGWGRCRDRGWGMRVWRSYKMLITVERRHDAARCGVRFGVALLCIVMFTFVILMIRIPRKIATRVYCML